MQHWDGISGNVFDRGLVEEARREEVAEAEAMTVWTKVPRSEAYTVTGKPPIGTRWVDTDKGDSNNPNVRSRIVAQELKREPDFDRSVATPPTECVKFVASLVASTQLESEKCCLMVQDIKNACFFPRTGPERHLRRVTARGSGSGRKRVVWEIASITLRHEGCCGELGSHVHGRTGGYEIPEGGWLPLYLLPARKEDMSYSTWR